MNTVEGQAPGEGFSYRCLIEARHDDIYPYVVPALRSRGRRIVGFMLI